MINIQLTELDLSLEVAEISDLGVILDEHSTVGLQGPLVFGVNATPIEFGYLDLDLIGFPYHGLSAYELAVQNGFVGTLAEWLESLRGEPGGLSPEGTDAVIRAETAATSAAGSATAAAGFRTEAFTYSGYAGVHAQSAAEMYTQAVAMRDETGQIAQAFTSIYQQSEAMLIGTTEIANATIQQRVLAETARAEAYGARDLAVNAVTTATSASVTASEQATLAVEARNEAADEASAAVIARSEASSFADDARVEAEASQESRIVASAARDEVEIAAAAVIIHRDEVIAISSDIEEIAIAVHEDSVSAETSAGTASVDAIAAASSRADALGFRNEAQTALNLTVAARDAAGLSATASFNSATLAGTYADTSGVLYAAVATRQDTLESNFGTLSGQVTTNQGTLSGLIDIVEDMDSDLTGLSSTLSGLSGTVSGLSGSLSGLTGTVSGLASDVSGLGGEIDTLGGEVDVLATDVEGVQERTVSWWEIATIAGSALAGIRAQSDSAGGSQIGIIADAIALFNTVLGNAEEVLIAAGGEVFIKKKLTLGALGEIVLDPSYPAIIWSFGSVRLAIGELTNDSMVLWFGPTQSMAAMNKTNATIWFDAVGGAYFGGQIISGTLSTSIAGSDIGTGQSITTNQFGTNGGAIAVNASYTMRRVTRRTANSPVPADASAVIRLYRTIVGVSAETLVATYNCNGYSRTITELEPNDYLIAENLGGGGTYMDTAGGTADRIFRLEVVSRSLGTLPGVAASGPGPATVFTQRYGIVTSEG